jgi:hypothetical protein
MVESAFGEGFNIPYAVAVHYVEVFGVVRVDEDSSIERVSSHLEYLPFLYCIYIIPQFEEKVNR